MLKKTLQLAVLSTLGALMMPAHATLVTTTGDVTFGVTGSVSDTLATSGATTQTNVNLGTTKLNQFNSSTGVLTGVGVNLTSVYKQTTKVTTPGTSSGNNNGSASAAGTGSSAISLVVPTSVSGASATLSANDTCAGKPKDACNDDPTSKSVNDNVAIGSASLNAYVGSGTVDVTHMATSLSAQTTTNTFGSTATTTSTVNWDGTLSATYSYLLHAASSFSGASVLNELTLDFGSVYLGSTVTDQAFSIYNLLGDRVGLALTSFTESGDSNNLFSTSLSTFNKLGAGANNAYSASFLANALGSFSASYQITLADVAPDVAFASNTLGSGYSLTLNLKGNVIEQEKPTSGDVPEPASLMLMGLGAAALGASRKRRKA